MRTSLSAKVLSRSLPKSSEEAAIPDLRETVRPRCDIVNKLSQLHWIKPMDVVEKTMQKPSGKVACDSTALQNRIRRINRFGD